jgi:tRNA pseudouridine55 synthase
MDGILNLNKPSGMTSFGVVARVKRITGEKHTGHAGTLDPLATGVLPVCLGQATRVIPYLFAETKTYRAEVELGKSTDTYDISGQVTRTGDAASIQREDVENMLPRFRGNILQVPPMYSALKFKGKPLYELARSGIEVERKTRTVQIFRLEISKWQPPVVTLDIDCGKGTYIRSLAHDLGETLGCGANMQSLVRSRVGPFRIEEALTIQELEEAFQKGAGDLHVYPPDYVLQSFNAIVVSHEQMCSLVHGMPITTGPVSLPHISESFCRDFTGFCRAYTEDGCFVGMLRYEKEQWYPEKIFFKPCCR